MLFPVTRPTLKNSADPKHLIEFFWPKSIRESRLRPPACEINYGNVLPIHDMLAAYVPQQEKDRSNRFDFLLQQTELFAHFITTGDIAGKSGKAPTSPLKMKIGRPKMKKDEKSKLMEAGE